MWVLESEMIMHEIYNSLKNIKNVRVVAEITKKIKKELHNSLLIWRTTKII